LFFKGFYELTSFGSSLFSFFKSVIPIAIGAPEFKKLRNLELEHSEPNSDFIDKL